MASKASGGTRKITPSTRSIGENRSIFTNEMYSPGVVRESSYFSEKTGAFSIFMEGHNYVPEEIEAAQILADEGYTTILTPEGVTLYATAWNRRKGTPEFSDGILAGFTYEQSTPNPDNNTAEGRAKSINRAIQHARDKGSRVALIYDKHEKYHREDIKAGIELFEEHNQYRVAAVITINNVHPKNRVNEWWHTKK